MRYEDIRPAVFLARPNRFVAVIETEKGRETAHVMNTGRCRELLIPGARIYVQRRRGEGRKTPYALVAVEKGERLINMDSQAPNAVWAEALAGGMWVPGFGEAREFRREAMFGTSRLDFQASSAGRGVGYMEIKGVTLEEEGIARFPDAPTVRGGAPFARADPGGGAGAARGGGVCHPNGGDPPVRAQRGHRSRLCPGPVRSGGRRGDGAGLRLRGHARFPADSTAGGGAAVAGKNWI